MSDLSGSSDSILEALQQVLEARKLADPESSYVAGLYAKGLNKILEKLGEECTEVIIAAKDAEQRGNNDEVIYEMADLWFHSLVLLAQLDTDVDAVCNELARRFNLSGLVEKANRQKG